jgi:hypothetical protein
MRGDDILNNQDNERVNKTESPDLLRRFVPTPVKAAYRVGGVRVRVQTNDFALLQALPLDADPDADHAQADRQGLEWTLIRDADSNGPLERPMFMTTEALTVVVMGTACLVGLDHERRELFGFIGAEVDARIHQEFLVPILCEMTTQVVVSDQSSRVAPWSRKFANG